MYKMPIDLKWYALNFHVLLYRLFCKPSLYADIIKRTKVLHLVLLLFISKVAFQYFSVGSFYIWDALTDIKELKYPGYFAKCLDCNAICLLLASLRNAIIFLLASLIDCFLIFVVFCCQSKISLRISDSIKIGSAGFFICILYPLSPVISYNFFYLETVFNYYAMLIVLHFAYSISWIRAILSLGVELILATLFLYLFDDYIRGLF